MNSSCVDVEGVRRLLLESSCCFVQKIGIGCLVFGQNRGALFCEGECSGGGVLIPDEVTVVDGSVGFGAAVDEIVIWESVGGRGKRVGEEEKEEEEEFFFHFCGDLSLEMRVD